MADQTIIDRATKVTPDGYLIQGAQEIILKAVTASFNGSGAGGAYVPALQIVSPSGDIVGTYPCGTTLAAGASADVSWFPRVGSGGGSGSGGGVRTVAVRLDTPDATSHGYPALTTNNGFANVRRVLPAFTKSVDGTWEGSLEVPADWKSGGTLTLSWAANATTGNLRNRVGTAVAANAVSLDTAYTQETYVNTTVAATAKQRFQSSFALSTTLAAGSTLAVQVTRNGSSGSDTLSVDALLIGCDLSYTSGY